MLSCPSSGCLQDHSSSRQSSQCMPRDEQNQSSHLSLREDYCQVLIHGLPILLPCIFHLQYSLCGSKCSSFECWAAKFPFQSTPLERRPEASDLCLDGSLVFDTVAHQQQAMTYLSLHIYRRHCYQQSCSSGVRLFVSEINNGYLKWYTMGSWVCDSKRNLDIGCLPPHCQLKNCTSTWSYGRYSF